MEFLQLVLCAILGYLLGNIQTGLIIGKLNNTDLRKHGSGSSGATNAFRVLGKQSAAFTLLGDFLKGMAAAGIGMLIAGQRGGMVGAAFVVIGHIWPVFYGFRGGKGVATSMGSLLLLFPIQTLIMVAAGILVLAITKIVSLASITGAVVFLISGIITAINRQDWFMLVFVVFMVALVIFAHRANIGRLIHGTESKISAGTPKKK